MREDEQICSTVYERENERGQSQAGSTNATELVARLGHDNYIHQPDKSSGPRAKKPVDKEEYYAKLTSTLKKPTKIRELDERVADKWAHVAGHQSRRSVRFSGPIENESLLDGFILLRLAQLLNSDVHYIGLVSGCRDSTRHQLHQARSESGQQLAPLADGASLQAEHEPSNGKTEAASGSRSHAQTGSTNETRKNLLDELAEMNPLGRFIERHAWLDGLCRLAKIALSLVAIMISLDKSLSTILLCLLSRADLRSKSADSKDAYEASDVSMSWFVLVLVNLSSTYILFSTVFNGHLLWQLLGQRLFLVSRRFQYKTMLSLIVFLYLEYILNIAFINNLFGWPFDVAASSEPASSSSVPKSIGVHNSYSVLSNLQIFVTEKDERNGLLDITLTIFQFARGIIRMSPYITINYVIVCLNEHIKTIRNQALLTESLKKREKLRPVVTYRRANGANLAKGSLDRRNKLDASATGVCLLPNASKKKRVIFVTQASGACATGQQQTSTLNGEPVSDASTLSASHLARLQSPSPTSLASSYQSPGSLSHSSSVEKLFAYEEGARDYESALEHSADRHRESYLKRIENFEQLESCITNLYIFTGRLNRLMSQQGLAIFFIVHNLLITCSLIVPEAISGGPPMVGLTRALMILIGIVPFFSGQKLNGQLGQLSRQIDRIIIKQQFIGRKRDNLVRIRELLHDIRVNCGGMLNFNVEAGIKYLAVAFASAFFIEQEGKFCAMAGALAAAFMRPLSKPLGDELILNRSPARIESPHLRLHDASTD